MEVRDTMEFKDIDLNGPQLEDHLGAEFTRCTGAPDFRASGGLEYTVHIGCAYVGADFTGVNLRAAIFDGCTLENCRFDESHLRGSLFDNCVFINSPLSGAADKTGLIVR